MLNNRFFFGLTIAVTVIFQIAAAYFSVQEILAGNFIMAFLYFLFVPGLGLIIGFYYARHRENTRRERDE